MYYVIMDLEWDNVFVKKIRGYINEIIEIGAVLVDDDLNFIDDFTCLVKPISGRKLTSQVKRLTHITNEEIRHAGLPFHEAIKAFRAWLPPGDTVFMSWGSGDLRALLDNYFYYSNAETVPFIKKYANLQNYCQPFTAPDTSNQIGLVNAAEVLGIDVEKYQAHRARDDSYIAYECLKKCYDADRLPKYIKTCDKGFYKRLRYKAVTVTDIHNPRIDRHLMTCHCDICGNQMRLCGDWKSGSTGFKALFGCPACNIFKRCTIKFVELADGMDIKISYRNAYEINGNENNAKE
ncbi:MAG: exonuclease domain-containing protein [Clostridia bacterium]|nr:exonuclease domain-containing protein [Clostridia bacterium]